MRSTALIAPLLFATAAFGQFVAPAAGSSSGTRTTASATSSLPSGVPPPPTESVGCELHGDHYHCEGPATGTVSGVPAAPTESTGCVLHGDHYHCEGNADGSEVEADSAEGGECVIHVGHTHGDCSAQDLACGAVLLENYNMGLHIGSIFIVLASSALGVMIPLISGWARQSNGDKVSSGDPIAFGRKAGFWASLFFVAKHFGTGIIISTAFIHLLFHGFVMFQNECVGHLSYESTAAAIAMAGALITFLLDYIGSRLASQRTGTIRNANANSDSETGSADGSADAESPREKNARFPPAEPAPHGHSHDCAHVDAAFAAEESWRVTLLEAGIIFHSIMIGVTLGAASGSGFTTLLIVITFHQFFEGAALGARIALLYWISKIRAIIMGIAFILITPVGIAIGIGVRQSFSQNGKASLLSVGILNAISAGILLYTAFKLLAHDFVDGPLKHAPVSRVAVALAAMVVGLIAMSVLGKWA